MSAPPCSQVLSTPSTCIFHFSGLFISSCVSPHIPTQFIRAEYLQSKPLILFHFTEPSCLVSKAEAQIHYCMHSQGSIMGITSLRWYLLYLYYVKSLKPWWYVFSVQISTPQLRWVGKGIRGQYEGQQNTLANGDRTMECWL